MFPKTTSWENIALSYQLKDTCTRRHRLGWCDCLCFKYAMNKGSIYLSRAIFQRMINYTIYAVFITICVLMGFMIIALIWKFDYSPFMVLIVAILNDGTIITISKDSCGAWKLQEIFDIGVVLGSYLAVMSVIFF